MIAVLDYGIGNLRSAEKALLHVGAKARLVSDPDVAASADAVVLPGVGNFGACVQALRSCGLEGTVRETIRTGRPFLGICVGMQMLYEGSEESPAIDGLGILEGVVKRLPDNVKRPQMQWNRLDIKDRTEPLLAGIAPQPWVYFVHSYAVSDSPAVIATCEYGTDVAAIVATPSLWATQFHPEKSGDVGLAILSNFAGIASQRAGLPSSTPVSS